MHFNSLIAKDLDFPDIQFTYESDDGLCCSWVGSCIGLTNPTFVQEITVISSDMNLSDHYPLCVKLDCAQACTKAVPSIVTFSVSNRATLT